jgi:hypothetical protein
MYTAPTACCANWVSENAPRGSRAARRVAAPFTGEQNSLQQIFLNSISFKILRQGPNDAAAAAPAGNQPATFSI